MKKTTPHQRVRMIEAKYVGPSNTRGARVRIFERPRFHDETHESKIFEYDYEHSCVYDQALELLEQNGFNVVSVSHWRDSYVFLVDNWGDEYIRVKDMKQTTEA